MRIRIPKRMAVAAVTVGLAACSRGGTPPPPPTPQWGNYAQDVNWLCRPGSTRPNACTDRSLDATVVQADGSRTVKHYQPLDQTRPGTAPFDCFYAYPTVNSGDPTASLDEENFVIRAQFARYSTVCNTYAPFYRQSGPNNLSDLENAFEYYLQHWNNGRKFVLLGHSQGTILLQQMIAQRIDNNPGLRSRLISALLVGGTVQVPPGRDVGATFQHIKLCHRNTDTGCVIAYNSYGSVPSDLGSGTATTHGACTNPAALAGGSGILDPYLITFQGEGPSFLATGDPMGGLPQASTRYVELPGALKAECVPGTMNDYLHITTNESAGDTRNVAHMLEGRDGIGLHIVETNMTLGNLIATVVNQAHAAGA